MTTATRWAYFNLHQAALPSDADCIRMTCERVGVAREQIASVDIYHFSGKWRRSVTDRRTFTGRENGLTAAPWYTGGPETYRVHCTLKNTDKDRS